MRIISGKLKGRRLNSFKADHIRPTTDRVKESLFNILSSDVPESRVLDLFSGTGNLAIESYSRGATYVEAVEMNKKSIEIIKSNLQSLDLLKQIKLVQQDVFKYLKSYKGPAFDLVFVDPPFTEKIAHQAMEAIAMSSVCRLGGVVIIESSAHERIDDQYLKFKLLDRRHFGDKSASIFRNE